MYGIYFSYDENNFLISLISYLKSIFIHRYVSVFPSLMISSQPSTGENVRAGSCSRAHAGAQASLPIHCLHWRGIAMKPLEPNPLPSHALNCVIWNSAKPWERIWPFSLTNLPLSKPKPAAAFCYWCCQQVTLNYLWYYKRWNDCCCSFKTSL